MKIEDGKRLVEITMRVYNNGQYSQDLSVGLLVDGSFEHGQGAYKVDSVDDVIDYAFDWQNCTGDFVEDEDPDDCRRIDVDIISDSSHEKPYDEFTARAQQVKSDALATDEAAALFDGGWRSSDYYQLMLERRCDKEEAAGICAALATFEQQFTPARQG